MTNQNRGDTAEAAAIWYYTEIGCICSKPMFHSPYYDLIVDRCGTLFKVEVKSSSHKKPSGNYEVKLVTKGGNKTANREFKRISRYHTDIVFIKTENGDMYEFDVSDLHARNSVTVNTSMKEFVGNK